MANAPVAAGQLATAGGQPVATLRLIVGVRGVSHVPSSAQPVGARAWDCDDGQHVRRFRRTRRC